MAISRNPIIAAKIAQEGGRFLAADGESHLHFARGAKLYRLK